MAENIELTFGVLVAVNLGLVEVIKKLLPEVLHRYTPLISLAVGMCLALSIHLSKESLIMGIIMGLSASGLYSGAKHSLSK